MHPLFQQYQATLLGRIKARSLSKLSGSVERIPSQREMFRELFRLWKSNSNAGRFYFNLINCNRIDRVEFPAHFPAKAVRRILKELNRSEYFDRIYAEGRAHGEEDLPQIGCLVLGHQRPTGEPGYYAAIYRDDDAERCSFCSLVPDGKEGAGQAAILTSEGWNDVSPEKVNGCLPLRVMFAAFRHRLDEVDPRQIPVSEIKKSEADEPPFDGELMRRLEAVIRGEMQVTMATISLKRVVPNSMDFCFHFSSSRLQPLASRIQRGYRPAMAVYWNDSEFVMSDDYPCYLAYRQADCNDVSVAILGEFPANVATVQKCGGAELLPPIGLGTGAVYPAPLSKDFKAWQLEANLCSNTHKNAPVDLVAAWMGFADLLDVEEVDERELHEFISKYPEVLTAYGTRIDSEVRLGTAYRIDLAVRSSGICEEVTLVELEHHHHDIFTRDGQARAEITHAVQQVQDWFRWLRENPTEPFAASLRGIPPKGLVVAGRSRSLSDEQRSRLAHLNSTNPVQVITYDELLDRLADLILSQLDESGS